MRLNTLKPGSGSKRTRRRVGLSYGDLVLVMAHRRCGGVLIHPPAALDGLLASSRRLLEVVP